MHKPASDADRADGSSGKKPYVKPALHVLHGNGVEGKNTAISETDDDLGGPS